MVVPQLICVYEILDTEKTPEKDTFIGDEIIATC